MIKSGQSVTVKSGCHIPMMDHLISADRSKDMEIINSWLDWTMSLSQLFNHNNIEQLTAMITDIRKHINGDFNANQLLKHLDNVQKPFSADPWQVSSPAAMIGVATHSCGCICCLEEMLCSGISHSSHSYDRCSTVQPQPQTQNQSASAPNEHSAESGTVGACLCTTKSDFQFFKTDGPCSHLHLNKGKALSVVHSSFQNSRFLGGVKTEQVFPGLSVLRKNNKMEVLSPEK
jgi:hypothetical protein